jgi:hypothetical protein
MKNLIQNVVKALMVIVFAASTVAAFAIDSESPSITINKIGYEKKIGVVMKNLSGEVTITIQSESGSPLVEEKVNQAEYAKIFNVANLEAGNYVFTVKSGLRELEQPFEVVDKGLVLDAKKRREFFAPMFKSNGENVDFQIMAGKLTTINVNIRNSAGEVVFEDLIKNVVKVEKRYSLRQLPKGNYTVMVSTPEKDYFYDVRK